MSYDSIIISGPKYVGKTTLVKKIVEKGQTFRIIKTVTTRKQRDGEDIDAYDFISKERFTKLKQENKLILDTEYNKECYGIEEVEAIKAGDGIPIFVVEPSTVETLENNLIQKKYSPLTFFVDADDKDIATRIQNRKDADNDLKILQQREIDREFKNKTIFYFKNNKLEDTVNLFLMLWKYRDSGGVLHKDLIQSAVKSDLLLQNANPSHVTAAAYDLHLGEEYYYGGKVRRITKEDPFFRIDPYDYAIVTSKEIANLPRNISSRFNLTVSLFTQGIILSNGTQIDPGFRGKLFCLLFNTSNKPVVLKKEQKYATIEFNKLISHTEPYIGKYQDKNEIISYLPSNVMQGAVSELKKELDNLKKETKNINSYFMGIIALILALIPLMLLFK